MESIRNPVGESFKKAFLEEWIFNGDDSSDEQRVTDFPVLLHSTGNTDYIRDDHPPTPRPSRQPDFLPWEPTRPQDKAYFWERIEAPLPPVRPRCNFIHPRQLSPFPERLELPFSSDEILSGFEDIVSSGTDQFIAWVKMDPHEVLVHHMVDVQKATADKLRTLYKTESIINDLGKKGKFNIFSEASKRTIREFGNIELYELGEMSKTGQIRT